MTELKIHFHFDDPTDAETVREAFVDALTDEDASFYDIKSYLSGMLKTSIDITVEGNVITVEENKG